MIHRSSRMVWTKMPYIDEEDFKTFFERLQMRLLRERFTRSEYEHTPHVCVLVSQLSLSPPCVCGAPRAVVVCLLLVLFVLVSL